MDIKYGEGLEFFLSYECNYKCIFCFENKIRGLEKKYSRLEIKNHLKKGYIDGKRFVLFSGGEPTLDNNLEYYISYSNKLGYKKIIIHTNGTKTHNLNYFKKLYNLGLSGIVFSFHGYGKISNIITKNIKSFYFLNNSLINASIIKKNDKNFTIDVNTVINKYNISTLFVLFKYLYKFPISRRMLTFPYSMFGFSNIELKNIFPNFDLTLKELKKILDFSLNKKIADVVIESIPYCFFEEKYWNFIEKNYRTEKNIFIPEDNGIDQLNSYHLIDKQHYTGGKIKFKNCTKCDKDSKCLGISEDFSKIHKNLKLNFIC